MALKGYFRAQTKNLFMLIIVPIFYHIVGPFFRNFDFLFSQRYFIFMKLSTNLFCNFLPNTPTIKAQPYTISLLFFFKLRINSNFLLIKIDIIDIFILLVPSQTRVEFNRLKVEVETIALTFSTSSQQLSCSCSCSCCYFWILSLSERAIYFTYWIIFVLFL